MDSLAGSAASFFIVFMTFQFSLKDFVVDETSVVMCAVGGMGVVINTAAAIFLSHKLKKHYSPFLR